MSNAADVVSTLTSDATPVPSTAATREWRSDWQWLRGYLHVTASALLVFGGLALLLVLAATGVYSNLTLLLFACGASGAVVVNYRTISQLAERRSNLPDALTSTPVTLELYIAPLMGGVFALTACALFFSGLVQGALFPKLAHTEVDYTTFQDLFAQTHPATFADAMKAIFWAFVAGYSKRFIPNAIDRLAARGEEQINESQPSPNTA